jgi:hypothetical protein
MRPGARRMRRLRERRRGGCLFVARVEVMQADVAALVRTGRLAPDRRGDRAAVLAAVERLLDDFARRAEVRV